MLRKKKAGWQGGKLRCRATCQPVCCVKEGRELFALLHGGLQGSEGVIVAQAVGGCLVLDLRRFLGSLLGSAGLTLGTLLVATLFKGAAMAEEDALALLVELEHLEGKLFAFLCLRAIFLLEVLRRAETFYTILQLNDSALLDELGDGALVNATLREYGGEYVPGVLLELLVTEAEATVVLVDFEDNHFNVGAELCELSGVLDLLRPAEVGDVDEAVNALFQFNEHAEVCEVAYATRVAATHGELLLDVCPGVVLELLQTERHLTLLTVEGEDDGFDFVAHLQEFLSTAEVLAPAHLADVDEAFHTGSNLYECTVIGHDYYAALDFVAHLKLCIKSIPGMRRKLLETESDALLLLVEIKDDNVELLVELHDFLRVTDAAPAEVGDVDETIDATQVDEYTVGCDVLDRTFEYLSLLELADDLLLLSFELCLDEGFVADNDILVLLVDLDNLEFHRLADKYVVVADGLHVDLAARQECLDAEYVDNHAALCAALDESLDDLLVLERLIDTVPSLAEACLAVGKDELATFVLLRFNVDLYGVAHFQVGIVTEFGDGDGTFALVADADGDVTLGDGHYGAFHHIVFVHLTKGLCIDLLLFLVALATYD